MGDYWVIRDPTDSGSRAVNNCVLAFNTEKLAQKYIQEQGLTGAFPMAFSGRELVKRFRGSCLGFLFCREGNLTTLFRFHY